MKYSTLVTLTSALYSWNTNGGDPDDIRDTAEKVLRGCDEHIKDINAIKRLAQFCLDNLDE